MEQQANQSRGRILLFVPHYLPGNKAGGTIRSTSNMVAVLGREFDFGVVTADRDLHSNTPYPGIQVNDWNKVGNGRVYYLAPGPGSLARIFRILRTESYDVLYLNGVFPRRSSMWPVLIWRLGLIGRRVPLLIAPRGEFSPGALGIKPLRKWLYLRLARLLGLYRGAAWHVSTPLEGEDTARVFGPTIEQHVAAPLSRPVKAMPNQPRGRGKASKCFVASDLAAAVEETREGGGKLIPKNPGQLRIAFLSRISRKKNLDYALRLLEKVPGDIEFNVYGPMEDGNYWSECEAIARSLPANVKVAYLGEVPHAKVVETFRQNHVFLFPTLGENFGHVIVEAFLGGCPVLLSDQTPWRDLSARGVGWDLPLEGADRFREVLERLVNLSAEEYEVMASNARRYGHGIVTNEELVAENRRMFDGLRGA